MSAQAILVSGYYYLPFWVVNDYLDDWDSQDPFVKCKVLRLTQVPSYIEDDPKPVDTCDIEIRSETVNDVPQDYLIAKEELNEWASKFAQWFVSFANSESKI